MMNNQLVGEEKFSKFYEKWMEKLEDHLELLLKITRENNSENEIHMAAVNKLTAHHKEFYTVKWAHEDVLAFFAPVWLMPLENVNLWVTGWKPSMIFRLVESLKKTSLVEMTVEQARKIESLRVNIKTEEEKVEMEMERQQVRIADRNIVELMRLESFVKRNDDSVVINRVNGLVDAALRGLLAGLKDVMKRADCVRLKTLKGVLDILNSMQCIHFLAAMSMLQIHMRRWDRNKDNKSSQLCNMNLL